MTPTFKALSLLLISLGLAFIFNSLFFEKVPGISVLLFTTVLVGTIFVFDTHHRVAVRKGAWLLLLIAFFALMPSLRANEFLTFLNMCATLGLLLILAHELTGTPAWVMRLRDYLTLATLVPLRMLQRALATITLVGQIHSRVEQRDVWVRSIKGIVFAIPFLILFAILFSQADLAFSQFLKGFADIQISERTIQYCVVLAFAFVAALGFLSYIFFPKTLLAASQNHATSTTQPGKNIEMMVFLGLISALFFVFIGFQITYLFGGETNIVNAGFTYAEYARRGFWELLAVAILSLAILFAAEKYAVTETKRDARFLAPALFLIAEVGIIIASAFKRLSLYIDAYGMTMLRFYVAGFIVLLLTLFTLLAIKFIASKREQFFAFGTLLSIAAFLIIVNLVNPDAFIAKANMKQYNQTGKIDIVYFGHLSADAMPWKIALYKNLQGEEKETLRMLLLDQRALLTTQGEWQSANLSRSRAFKLLLDSTQILSN